MNFLGIILLLVLTLLDRNSGIQHLGFKVLIGVLQFFCNSYVKATKNVTQASWDSILAKSSIANNHLACAHQCARETWDFGQCNAWKYDPSQGICEMGILTFLEDTNNQVFDVGNTFFYPPVL